MLRGSQENIVQDIVVTPDLIYVTRGQAKLDPERFRIEDYILARGRSLRDTRQAWRLGRVHRAPCGGELAS
jgi:hypothetical protein